jgi:hypothetical protein
VAQRGEERASIPIECLCSRKVLAVGLFGGRESLDEQIERARQDPDLIDVAHRNGLAARARVLSRHLDDAFAHVRDVRVHGARNGERDESGGTHEQRGERGNGCDE